MKFTELMNEQLLASHVATDESASSKLMTKASAAPKDNSDTFSLFGGKESALEEDPNFSKITWATDNYADLGYDFHHEITKTDFIVPRIEKSKEARTKRTKEKAEVFTPSWVCNLQNNLIDDHILGPGKFNKEDKEDRKKWVPTKKRVFKETELKEAIEYIASPRLEITCGEGPYLFSPYDTTTGEVIPVKEKGKFYRIGILDRKFRVITETVDDLESWEKLADLAMNATFGYEWQGDNLFLARRNFVQTYYDFFKNAFPELEPSDERLLEVCATAARQLWQMDGLKFTTPNCGDSECKVCSIRKETKGSGDKKNSYYPKPIIFWNGSKKLFEDFMD